MRKPFPEFYHLLLDRYSLAPGETIFIDDSVRNVKAAESIGIRSIHYTNPLELERQLIELSLLSKK
jgi:2-haloacid dehalogenase